MPLPPAPIAEDSCLSRFNVWLMWHRVRKEDFVVSAWAGVSTSQMLIFRAFHAFVFSFLLCWSWFYSAHADTWLIYLTHWGQVVVLIYFITATYLTYNHLYNADTNGTANEEYIHKSWGYKFHYAVFETALDLQWVIVLVYWGLLFSGGHASAKDWILELTAHGYNLVAIMIEFSLCRVPFFWRQVVVVVAFGAFYALFNGIYTAAQTYVYSIITWEGAGSWILVLVLLLVVVIVHGCLIGCTKARASYSRTPETVLPYGATTTATTTAAN